MLVGKTSNTDIYFKTSTMKQLLIIVFLSMGLFLQAQRVDYNITKDFGANGYDVVSYFDGKALEGKKEFATNYDGVNYKFLSDRNRAKFIADPTAYLPQYGGYCAYAMAVNGKKVNVDPGTFEIREGKLYLFYNRGKNNTLQFWLDQSPEVLKSKADKNWQHMKN